MIVVFVTFSLSLSRTFVLHAANTEHSDPFSILFSLTSTYNNYISHRHHDDSTRRHSNLTTSSYQSLKVGITRSLTSLISYCSHQRLSDQFEAREKLQRSHFNFFSIVYQHQTKEHTRRYSLHSTERNLFPTHHTITHHLTSNIIPFLYSNCLKLFALSLLTLFYYILCFDVRYASFHFQWVSVRVWRVISILAW
eukprot:505036_1